MIFNKKPKIIKKVPLKTLRFFKDLSPRYDWETLKKSLDEKGYRPKEFRYIETTRKGLVINGNHRCHLLAEKYGYNYEVEIHERRTNGMIFTTIAFFFVFPFYLIIQLIGKMVPKFLKTKTKNKRPRWGFWIASDGKLLKEWKI